MADSAAGGGVAVAEKNDTDKTREELLAEVLKLRKKVKCLLVQCGEEFAAADENEEISYCEKCSGVRATSNYSGGGMCCICLKDVCESCIVEHEGDDDACGAEDREEECHKHAFCKSCVVKCVEADCNSV